MQIPVAALLPFLALLTCLILLWKLPFHVLPTLFVMCAYASDGDDAFAKVLRLGDLSALNNRGRAAAERQRVKLGTFRDPEETRRAILSLEDLSLRRHNGNGRLLPAEWETAAIPPKADARLASIVESIVHSSEDAIICKTLNGTIAGWNPAAEKLFGFTQREVLGKSILEFLPVELQVEERNILRRIAKGEEIGPFASRQSHKQGKWIDVEVTISALRDSEGRVVGAWKIARPVLRKRREEEPVHQLANLLDRTPAFVRDMQARVVYWTQGAVQLYGFTREEALGKVVHELLQTEFPRPLEEIERLLFDQGGWEGQLIHRTREGQRVVVASQWVLQCEAGGKPIQILQVNADITELKRTEALHLASQKLETLGKLAGGIAHDFNNILAAIHGSAAVAIAQLPSSNAVRGHLTDIEKAGERGAHLIRQILSFTRPKEPNLEPQRMERVVEEGLRFARAALPATIAIQCEFDCDLPAVRADETQIHQVILNLATNAAHAIGERRGRIDVKLDVVRVGSEEVSLGPRIAAGRYLRLLFRDDGCGMDATTVERVFDPFFTTKSAAEGTGLGLSTVRAIVSSHQGTVRVQSEAGNGSTFEILLPAVEEEALPDLVTIYATPPGHGERILLVDDESVLSRVSKTMLEQCGYSVTVAQSGEEALREFMEEPARFDLVLSDLAMPTMSGLELVRAVRELRADIPIFLVSGYFSPAVQRHAEEAGATKTLTKPVNSKQLLTLLHETLSGRRNGNSSATSA